MKKRSVIIIAVVATTGLFVTSAVAQHEDHHKDQVAVPLNQDADKASRMMSSNMMSQMAMGQNEMGKLVDQLMNSFIAIETEKDPAALKNKLAEHGLLLKELQIKVLAHSHMMEMMQHMTSGSGMSGPAAGAEHKN